MHLVLTTDMGTCNIGASEFTLSDQEHQLSNSCLAEGIGKLVCICIFSGFLVFILIASSIWVILIQGAQTLQLACLFEYILQIYRKVCQAA